MIMGFLRHVEAEAVSCDSSSTGSSSNSNEEIKLGPGRPIAIAGSSADTSRNKNRRKRYAERKKEKKLVHLYRQAVKTENDAEAEKLREQLASTVTGRKMFPKATKALKEQKDLKQLAKNVKKLNNSLGPVSKHRAPLMLRVTEGLPASFVEQILGVLASSLRQAKKRQQSTNTTPTLISESRTENGRSMHHPIIAEEIGRFFEANTHINSGAYTATRKLRMTQERMYMEFYANYPEILRKALKRDSSILPLEGEKTQRQLDIQRAEDAAKVLGFSVASEYKRRIKCSMDDQANKLMKEYLRKQGFQPEQGEGKAHSGDEIGCMAAETFWKVRHALIWLR